MSVSDDQKQKFTEAFSCFVTGVQLKEIKTEADFSDAVNELVNERQIPIEIVHAVLASIRSHMMLKGIWKQYIYALQNLEKSFLHAWLEDSAKEQIDQKIEKRKNAPSKEEIQAAKLREQGTPKLSVI